MAILAGCAAPEPEPRPEATALARPPAAEAPAGGYYKIGPPYAVHGRVYRPAADYDYTEIGIASWYGPGFHGRTTANGEIFDMNAPSAAHRTLPMPSMVRVINLANGRRLDVRINDRGPFVNDRIIDLSRRAAQLLGFERDGLARVRVEILAEESRRLAESMGVGAAPRSYFVQTGAFSDHDNARRHLAAITRFGDFSIVNETDGDGLYRVRTGPYRTATAAETVLRALAANGETRARMTFGRPGAR